MAYSGVINWGPVTAYITIDDVEKTGDEITGAEIVITINGQSKVLQYPFIVQ